MPVGFEFYGGKMLVFCLRVLVNNDGSLFQRVIKLLMRGSVVVVVVIV
jgi:hypothetical protein